MDKTLERKNKLRIFTFTIKKKIDFRNVTFYRPILWGFWKVITEEHLYIHNI